MPARHYRRGYHWKPGSHPPKRALRATVTVLMEEFLFASASSTPSYIISWLYTGELSYQDTQQETYYLISMVLIRSFNPEAEADMAK